MKDTDEIEGDTASRVFIVHCQNLKVCAAERSGSYVDRNPLQANNASLNDKRYHHKQIEPCGAKTQFQCLHLDLEPYLPQVKLGWKKRQ